MSVDGPDDAPATLLQAFLTDDPRRVAGCRKGGGGVEPGGLSAGEVIRMIKPGYLRMLDWSVGHEKSVVAIAVGLLLAAGVAFPFLGTAFVPVMQEGAVTPQIIRVPIF